MSNPETFYTIPGSVDLSSIFQPYTTGTPVAATGYKIPSGSDLSTVFAPYVSGYSKANLTNYTVNNGNYPINSDLKDIFAKKQSVFPTTNQLYTSSQTFSDFIMPAGKNFFEFSFCGSGGQGYTTVDDPSRGDLSYGGGGSGGWIQAKNIPYLLNSFSITSINITIGGTAASTVVTVNYGNSTMIKLTAGGGVSATPFTGNTGQAGGTCAITTNTAGWNSTGNYTSVTGAKGGDKNQSGVSSGKTSSGSGANNTSSAVNSINPAGPSASFSLGSITVTSQGGGRSPTVCSGYGSGGASTPANYTGTGGASAYRYGKYGCCIINLT